MFEISTEPLSRDLLKEMLCKAKGRHGYSGRSTELSCFEINKNVLPDLQGYVLAPKKLKPIKDVVGIADCSLDLFLRIAEPLHDHVKGCGVFYAIAQSQTVYNPEEERDLQLIIRHCEHGWGVGLAVGTLSAGYKDMLFRADLFRSLVRCAGLSESVHIRCEAGELSLESETAKHSHNLAGQASKKASDVGNCIYWMSGANSNNKNFSTLEFYFPGYSDFLTAAKRCTGHFFSLGSVVRTRFWLVNYDGDYEELRSFLSANFPCDDWRVMISGRPKYGIDDLDKMFEETDSLLLPLFVIKDRRVGEIDMELDYDKGALTLNFSTYTEEIDTAEKVIRQIVAELSDGKAVINEEV